MVVVEEGEAKEVHLDKEAAAITMEDGNVSVRMDGEAILREVSSDRRLKMEPVKDAVDRIEEFNKQVKEDGSITSLAT